MTSEAALPRRIVIVGMGYVGLPLAIGFSRHVPVVGYDISRDRIDALVSGEDHNTEISTDAILTSGVQFTTDPATLRDVDFIIVTVPTPIDSNQEPDLRPLTSASEMIGRQISKRANGSKPPVIVFESTTFPGCTEDVCGPVIEKYSGLQSGTGFKLGYSPERTNFGDQDHNLETVIKVVSGQDEKTALKVKAVYDLVAKSGTYVAPDIRTAEAAKVIENIQRDLNIALVNEFAMIFDKLGITTSEVLAAASTKWNFVPFRPGLVGGHCIPVDPYYLTHRAVQAGIKPQVILSGRQVNESMAAFIGDKVLELLKAAGSSDPLKILILGFAFKPNISDARNSKIADLTHYLSNAGASVLVHDPRVGASVFAANGIAECVDPFDGRSRFDAVVLATPHREFAERPADDLTELLVDNGVLIDVTGAVVGEEHTPRGVRYWRP